ncbi:hypothetical protein [Fontibacillus sp. BL9]|uniref:hypothetical protein n=1 Tax=Fontibacillus sp. BL9 TaxID=3389971 RepID=UPI0039781D12
MNKVSGFFNRTKNKITEGYNDFKTVVTTIVAVTKEGVNRFIDASVKKIRETGDWIVNRINQTLNKAGEIGAMISAGFIAFVQKVNEGWERLKARVMEIANTVKKTVIAASEAMLKSGSRHGIL